MKDYKTFITEVLDITKNVEGSGLPREVESVIKDYETYLNTTPVPVSVAKWVNGLYSLLDNCEGSGLERELARLKSPLNKSTKK
jgi:hypothetical protein